MTALLFAAVVFAWGFTWYAIKLQFGVVPTEVSIFWRFLLAAAVLWAGLALTGRLRRVAWRRHLWFAAMGVCLFGLNFVLIYGGSRYVASGIVSLVFTFATVFNAVNQWIFLARRPSPRTLAGSALGIAGIALLFGESVLEVQGGRDTAIGIALAFCGTYVFSVGNFVSTRATADGTDLPNAIVRGMSWGAALLGLWIGLRGLPPAIEPTPRYLLSLAYLAVIGSVVGFFAYLSLVARVGADRAAYATVLFPVIALAVSTLLEGYHWTIWAAAGLPLVLAGNLVIFTRSGVLPRLRRSPAFLRRTA
ncbi:DMT family transporter [Azospirillum thermophilum]|uniref:EamA family transporter n=1 Tax=Azospirillum thermophilum TaxID=2202148 RepID=A0A2S2CPW7_9PROT|nr:DMT family transporter [Azospirillum thermophilum]AWK86522.1 EamA family transporter [Azospirillum thermophilum]